MAQLFTPVANTIARSALLALLIVPLMSALGLAAFQWSELRTSVGFTQDQPVPFSHQHHAGELGIDCRNCHTSVETIANAGMPPTKTCMTCHSQIWTNAALLAPVRDSFASGDPIRWQRVNRLPDYVYFDHSIHVAKGVGCSTCHGDVTQMPLMRKAHSLTMGWCLECHRAPEKYLRPVEDVFQPDWAFPDDQAQKGAQLVAAYAVHKEHLTDCSVCHR